MKLPTVPEESHISRRRLAIPALVVISAALACGLPARQSDALPPVPVLPTAEPVVQAQPTAPPAAQEPDSVQPPALPPTDNPTFSTDIRFAAAPGVPPLWRTFANGTPEVFAVWKYAAMREGVTIRREWYRDNVLWLEREEAWDFATYGANGTIADISVFDYDFGLTPGDYIVRLYIDGVPQFAAADTSAISFRILPEGAASPLVSPNGSRSAFAVGGTLFIEEANGSTNAVPVTDAAPTYKITTLDWFPDSQRVIYSDADPDNAIATPNDIRYQLWIADVTTGSRLLAGESDEVLHTPNVSPNGRYVALLTGSEFGEACAVDRNLIFIELDNAGQRIAKWNLDDFSDVPHNTGTGAYPMQQPGIALPGVWRSNTEFDTGINIGCVPIEGVGLYRFNVPARTATRIADLIFPQ